MTRILGIDTSNYTTSISVVDENKIICDKRCLLNVKQGERGLRQSEALFQHINNLPKLLDIPEVKGVQGICISEKPRPLEDSYMPVFKAGEAIGTSISSVMDIPLFKTTHQEGHIEVACTSIDFNYNEFIALHLSGGTTEVLKVKINDGYTIDKIGGTKDISFGQFIDRIGVALGLKFPSGKFIDEMALGFPKGELRIPSKNDGYYFNLSGQETLGLKYVNMGYNPNDIAHGVMLCVAKTLEKVIRNLYNDINLPVILTGGVATSQFLRIYFDDKFNRNIYFCDKKYASDNAVGVAYIGLNKYHRGS